MKYALLALSGATIVAATAQAADTPLYLQALMKDVVAPQAQVLWDVGNRAFDDDGNPDASQLGAEDWSKLGEAAQAMKTAALAMADAPRVAVVPEGDKLPDEGAPGVATAKQVQGFIDADPKDFAAHARALADVSDSLLEASRTRKAQTLADASGQLDQVCEACHIKYWYPQ